MGRRLVLIFALLLVYAAALMALPGAQAGSIAPEGIPTASEYWHPAILGILFLAPAWAYLLALQK